MNFKNLPFQPLPEVRLAINAAIRAGKATLDVYNKDFSSTLKNDEEPLTEADLKSQEILLEELSKMKYPIISEEGNKEGLDNSKTWIIDPLDGTSDFIKKTGEFSVMISLVKKHSPIIGVIYQPVNNLLYAAQKGSGAYQMINGGWSRLSTNNISDIHKCKAIVSRHHLAENEKVFLNQLNISKFTQKGSCGLKVAEICKGKAELYFTTTDKIKQWDTCAAYCLIKESGGNITDMFGEDLEYNTEVINHKNGILVTNGKIHTEIIKRYKKILENNISA